MGFEVFTSSMPPQPAPMVLMNDFSSLTAVDAANPSRATPVGGAMVQRTAVYPSRTPALYYVQNNRLFRRLLCKYDHPCDNDRLDWNIF